MRFILWNIDYCFSQQLKTPECNSHSKWPGWLERHLVDRNVSYQAEGFCLVFFLLFWFVFEGGKEVDFF